MNCHIEIADPGERNVKLIRQLVDPFISSIPGGVVALTRDPRTDLAHFSFLGKDPDDRSIHGCPFPGLLVREPACADLLCGSLLEFLVHLKRRTRHRELHAA